MLVKILKTDKRIKGGVGDEVEIDAALGNPLACWGVVQVLKHESADGKFAGRLIKHTENDNELDEE